MSLVISRPPEMVVHVASGAPWWYASITTAVATLLSVLIAQIVVIRLERRRAGRENDRRFERDAIQAVGAFLSSVYAIDSEGGDAAMDKVRAAALAMDVFLDDALASSAEDVVVATARYIYADELEEADGSDGTASLRSMRLRLDLHKTARSFHNDFRESRGLPRRNLYVA